MERKIDIVNNWNLQTVFNELEAGNLKIPKFQREYVWERSKIVKLLNSIYKQYPIGAFFLWNAAKEHKRFCREIEDLHFQENPNANSYNFILDGQQRITSLYVALKGRKLGKIDFKSICFNIEKKQFQIPRLRNEKHNIPACYLFDTKEYGKVLKEYAVHHDTNLVDTWMECHQIFSDYPICVIKTLQVNLEEGITIFERINQGGKRLSLFDLVHAGCWSDEFDLRNAITEFHQNKNMISYGKIENEVFTQSLSLNTFSDCSKSSQLKLSAIDCINNWKETVKCIELTLDLLRNFGVRNASFISYSAQIPVIQHYFYKSKFNCVKSEHLSSIEKWFWTTIFSQRYSSSSLTKMNEDVKWIHELIKGNIVENVFPVTLSIKEIVKIKMNTNSVVKQGILCLMALKNPVDFDNGTLVNLDKNEISRKNSKENHHLFPYSLRKEFGANAEIHCVINFAFISKRLNGEISNKFPSDYYDKYVKADKKIKSYFLSHYIDEDCIRFITKNKFQEFIEQRAKNILNEIKNKISPKQFIDDSDNIIESSIEDAGDEEEIVEQENTIER